jgi:hypothetical protein
MPSNPETAIKIFEDLVNTFAAQTTFAEADELHINRLEERIRSAIKNTFGEDSQYYRESASYRLIRRHASKKNREHYFHDNKLHMIGLLNRIIDELRLTNTLPQKAASSTLLTSEAKEIFMSYRRDDSADVAGRIYDRLADKFGRDNVFKDVDSIPLGVNFKTHIEAVVQQCVVELVVIGQDWLDIMDAEGNRRLDDPRDFVRLEIESALARNIPIIPLLVMGHRCQVRKPFHQV